MKPIEKEIIIVGISGVTCGGKSTVAIKLKNAFENLVSCVVFGLDDYYKDEKDISIDPQTGLQEWDVIDAFKIDQLHQDVNNLIESKSDKSNVKTLLVIEGIMIFQDRFLNDLFNKRYFLTLPYDVAEKRRRLRVYEPPEVPELFDQHVWPKYIEYREELRRRREDMIEIESTQSIDDVFSFILEDVKQTFRPDK